MSPEREAETASYWGRHVPVTAALSLAGGLLAPIPIVNAVAIIGVPAMLAVLCRRRGESAVMRWLPALVPLLILLPVAGVRIFAVWPLALVVTAIILEQALRLGWEWRLTTLALALPPAGTFIGLWYAMVGEAGVREYGAQLWPAYADLLDKIGLESGTFEAQFEQSLETIIYVLPSQFGMAGIMTGLMTLAVTVWWLQRSGTEPGIGLEPYSCWELPRWMLVPFGVCLLSIATGGTVARAGANAAIVIAFLYFLQGFAIIWYSFEARGTAGWIRLLFALLAVIIIWPGLIILGVVETVYPFRRLMAGQGGDATEEGSDESDSSGGPPAPR